jgi:hypothetical protein
LADPPPSGKRAAGSQVQGGVPRGSIIRTLDIEITDMINIYANRYVSLRSLTFADESVDAETNATGSRGNLHPGRASAPAPREPVTGSVLL